MEYLPRPPPPSPRPPLTPRARFGARLQRDDVERVEYAAKSADFSAFLELVTAADVAPAEGSPVSDLVPL